MWGNRLGWTISAAMVVLTGAWLWFIASSANVTPPTEFSRDPRNLSALTLPPPPAGILPDQHDEDSSKLYRSAIDQFLAERALYEDFAARGSLDSPAAKELTAIDAIVRAAAGAHASIFINEPQELIHYAHDKPAIDA